MTPPQRSLAASRHNVPLCLAWFGQVFGGRAALHHWQAACQKAMYDNRDYQTCRTKRTCRNAERPHTETAPKQPLSRRAGEIKSRRAAPAGSGGPQGPQPEEADPSSKGRPGGHQNKDAGCERRKRRTRRSTRGRSPSTQTHHLLIVYVIKSFGGHLGFEALRVAAVLPIFTYVSQDKAASII